MSAPRLFLSCLFLAITLLLYPLVKGIFGWSPEFLLAFLISTAIYAPLLEVIFLSGLATWLIGWGVSLRVETALLFVIPVAIYVLKNTVLPWKNLLSVFLLVFAGVFLFYSASLPREIVSIAPILSVVAIGGGIWGMIIAKTMYKA